MAISRDPAMKKLLVFSLLFALSRALGATGGTEAKLDGVLIERDDGGILQLVIESNHVIFHFFDEQLNPLPADVDRITVRITFSQDSQRFTVAIPYEGIYGLRAPVYMRPPHIFKSYLALMRNGSDEPVEAYVVGYPEEGG